MLFIKSEWNGFISKMLWQPTIALVLVHIGAIYGFYLSIASAKWKTFLIVYILGIISNLGVVTVAHRYATHRSFKANLPLRVILCIMQTLTGQKSMIEWARDHHTHHKYEGTNADVVNINRGFFFAHIGWLMIKRHPECKDKRSKIDVSYLLSDPIIKFQHDFYPPLVLLFCIVIPTLIPYYLFNETIINGFFLCFALRYIYILHTSLCGNSVAHIWGYKKYDRTITATRNTTLNLFSLGAAYHNYHHVYPSDYSASEFGWESNININTAFIDLFAKIGWAYNLKTVPLQIIDKRRQRTGDQSQHNSNKRPILEWIIGMILGANILLIIIPIKIFYNL